MPRLEFGIPRASTQEWPILNRPGDAVKRNSSSRVDMLLSRRGADGSPGVQVPGFINAEMSVRVSKDAPHIVWVNEASNDE